MVIAGFDSQRAAVADGVWLHAAVGGSRDLIVLLRTIAADVVALDHKRFALAGHDRGALIAFRAGLDHPETVTHLACLDILPTLDICDAMHGTGAAVGFHLYLMAQPPGLPEQLIGASPDAFFGHLLDLWASHPEAIPADVRAAYLDACRDAVPSSWPTTAPPRSSTPSTIRRPRRQPDPVDADHGAPAALGRSARLRRGGPLTSLGPRTCTTRPSATATSWPRKRPPRSPRRCATS